MKRILAAAGAAFALTAAPLAQAQVRPAGQTQTQPLSRHDQLASDFMRAMMEAAQIDVVLRSKMPELTREMTNQAWFRPEWRPLMEQAMLEEFEADKPKLYLIMGRDMTKGMTDAELEVGVKFMRTSGGAALVRAGAQGLPTPKLTRAEERELDRLIRTPEGRSFSDKMGDMDLSETAMNDFIAEVLPGMLRRWAEKVEAQQSR